MAVKNEHLQSQIKALSDKLGTALDIWRDGLTRVLTMAADITDIKDEQVKVRAEVDKQTALANQIHDSHDASIERMTDIVEGNGKPGLKTDIAEMRSEIRAVANQLTWMIRILAPIGLALLGFAVWAGQQYVTWQISSSTPAAIVVPSIEQSYSYPSTQPAPLYPVALPTPTRRNGNNQ